MLVLLGVVAVLGMTVVVDVTTKEPILFINSKSYGSTSITNNSSIGEIATSPGTGFVLVEFDKADLENQVINFEVTDVPVVEETQLITSYNDLLSFEHDGTDYIMFNEVFTNNGIVESYQKSSGSNCFFVYGAPSICYDSRGHYSDDSIFLTPPTTAVYHNKYLKINTWIIPENIDVVSWGSHIEYTSDNYMTGTRVLDTPLYIKDDVSTSLSYGNFNQMLIYYMINTVPSQTPVIKHKFIPLAESAKQNLVTVDHTQYADYTKISGFLTVQAPELPSTVYVDHSAGHYIPIPNGLSEAGKHMITPMTVTIKDSAPYNKVVSLLDGFDLEFDVPDLESKAYILMPPDSSIVVSKTITTSNTLYDIVF